MKFPSNVIEAFLYDHFNKYIVKNGPNGRELCFNGPFEPDTRFRMSVNVPLNLAHDFNTGYSNNFIGFVGDLLDMSPEQAQRHIIKTYFEYLSFKEIIKPYRLPIKVIELAEINEPPGLSKITNKTELGIMTIQFLYRKNIAPELIKQAGLKYFSSGYYKARLYIPFYMNGKLVFFQARDILGPELFFKVHKRKKKYQKYLNPKGIQKSQIIYNYDYIKKGKDVVVVEGPFDAMTVNNGIAMLGHTISKAQARKIIDKQPKKIIFIPDNDKAGQDTLERNIKTVRELAPDLEVGYYELDKRYKDANEAGLKEVNSEEIKKDARLERIKSNLKNTSIKSFAMASNPDFETIKKRIQKV